jgi:IS30 family transposase
MMTHVERKSRYTLAALIPAKKAAYYTDAMIQCFRKLPPDKVKSFTVDHGKEFSKHRQIRDALGAVPGGV